MNNEQVKIEIWSDIVCPFCFLGKKKLERAIRKLQAEDKVEVVWHSYQLNPAFPKNTSMTSGEYLARYKGYPAAQLREVQDRLTYQGKDYGIGFRFDTCLTFNTGDAHRLWQWSRQFNRDNELKEVLMRAHFTEGVDLSVRENLVEAAVLAGLDREEANGILEGDAYADEVESDMYQARQLGVRGVPYFLVDEKAVISGAQADQIFENVLATALKYKI